MSNLSMMGERRFCKGCEIKQLGTQYVSIYLAELTKTTKKSIGGSRSGGFSWVGAWMAHRTSLEGVVKG